VLVAVVVAVAGAVGGIFLGGFEDILWPVLLMILSLSLFPGHGYFVSFAFLLACTVGLAARVLVR
jgi:hypothetical protein